VTRAIEQVAGQAEGHQVQALTGAIASTRQKMAGSGAQGWMARGPVRCKGQAAEQGPRIASAAQSPDVSAGRYRRA
jgi:hypothetical protein